MRHAAITLLLLLGMADLAHSKPFDEHLQNIEAGGGHYGYLLETGDDALLARLYLIRHATHSIDIQTFIWEADDSGVFVISELLKAARRGVKVRILIDDLSLRESAEHVPYLSTVHENLQVRQYNPLAANISANVLELFKGYALEFGNTNQRMHNKTFIVDTRFGITGGRNYANDYFDRGTERSFKDRDLLIVGDAVAAMQASFDEFWDHQLSVDSREMKDVSRDIDRNQVEIPDIAVDYEMPDLFAEVSECAETDTCISARIVSEGLALDEVQFVADHPDKTTGPETESNATRSIWQLIDRAQDSMTLQTPYLVIGGPSIRRLKQMRLEKPSLVARVSTNSLAASDHFYAYAYSYKNKKNYLKDFHLQIHEFKPQPADIERFVPAISGVNRDPKHYVCVHGKTFIFDSRYVWLGTFNLDRRSADLNTEAGLVIEDEHFAGMLEALIERDMSPANAWTIAPQIQIPLISHLNRMFESFFKYVPFVNIWPFRYSTSYELRQGAAELPFWHEDFHRNYRPVGQFPGATGSIKAIETRLWKAFLGPAEPIF